MPSIIELFKNKELLFPGGSSAEGAVKKDSETFIEQETSGIRIKSLVDINNPLIYGNEAARILSKSTPALETMKQGTAGETGDGGLVGKGLGKLTGGKINSVSEARNKINDKLGIPKLLIPSEVVTKIIDSDPTKTGGSEHDSQTPITQELYGKNGSEIGKFLKSTGGGNPTTIGKQALGKGIGVAKDKLRGALFGDPDSIGTAEGKTYAVEETTDQNTYSSVREADRIVTTKLGINLNTVSPIYGIKRKEGDRAGRKYGMQGLGFDKYDSTSKDKTKSGIIPFTTTDGPNNTLVTDYKLGHGDGINSVSPSDEYTMEDNAFMKVGEDVYKDFIPLWFKKIGADKPLVFRATISGLTETSTPSWSSNKFVGNPYSFHMYDGVERSLAFNIKLMAASPVELGIIWEKLKILTSYTYPTIGAGLTTPPIITFRLGDMYVDREVLVDSLTYTIPDESNWEIDGSIGYLPKTIDVALSMKFIEGTGAEDRLYDMEISKEAVKNINAKRTKEKDAMDLEAKNRGGKPNEAPIVKETTKRQSTVTVLKGKGTDLAAQASSTIKSSTDKAKDLKTNIADNMAGITDPISGQSAAADKLDGKSPLVAEKEMETKNQYTKKQAKNITNYISMGYKEVPKSSIPTDQVQFIQSKHGNPSVFMRKDKANGTFEIYQITPNFSFPIRVAGGIN